MPAHQKRNRSEYATSDLACTRCRERKIRCGRERPQCNNCERDDATICIYQNPAKRVNHIKLLYDGVSGIEDRLTTIESHLSRLTDIFAQSANQDGTLSDVPFLQPPSDQRSFDDGENDNSSESSSLHTDDSTDFHILYKQVDMAGRYHGLSSLAALCNEFRICNLAASNAPLQDMLQNLCEAASVTEPFPPYGDQPLIYLLPKQQAITAIEYFFENVDCTTDIFVQSNLLANFERVYSNIVDLEDEAWAICFQAITLLVLGMEITAQTNNALFGDFARSILPSRAALVNSRLLTTPKLINVQTLIILSVAAQQFDPSGWAELIFSHACMLARTMGLHYAPILPHNASTDDELERAKVVQSLYSRDKSLCTTRGSLSWLPSYDCNIIPQLRTAVKNEQPYSDRLSLAIIQEDIYRLTHATSRRKPSSTNKLQPALQSIDQHLDQYARAFGIFEFQASYFNSPRRAIVPLEFLATRILVLKLGSGSRYGEQIRSDARASCLLLLIALGDQDPHVINAFNSLDHYTTSSPSKDENSPAIESSKIPFISVLDAFSVPAFFILLEALLQNTDDDGFARSKADFDLLQRVSDCYNKSIGQMQPGSYHRKVAWVFDQLLKMTDLFAQAQHQAGPVPPTASVDEPMLSNLLPNISSLDPQPVIPSDAPAALTSGDLPNSSFFSQSLTSTSLSWGDWSPVHL
ncbi:hypothetical protein F5884DRAFT_320679 [Xylogone sp. PMI_703]|nr:hypothetical protein F5884DRAFT_320679 [Xylogone sp. PMI_703]